MKRTWIAATVFLLVIVIVMSQPATAIADAKLDEELLSWCGYGNLDHVADLLKQGASANATNEYGVTALHLAARDGNVKMMQLLMKSGAKVNTKNGSNTTPIYNAAGSGKANAVKILLDAGAVPDPASLGQACWLGHAVRRFFL